MLKDKFEESINESIIISLMVRRTSSEHITTLDNILMYKNVCDQNAAADKCFTDAFNVH